MRKREIDKEDFDTVKQPFNPLLYKSVKEFLEKQLQELPEHPEGAEYECVQCGDCCRYFYMHFKMPQQLINELAKRSKHPNGYWVLKEKKRVKRGDGPLHFFMPVFSAHFPPMMDWAGNIPEERRKFLEATGRRHGYWVFNGEDIVVYCPAPCDHLIEKDGVSMCDIYNERPDTCRQYYCKRHVKAEESK